MNQATTPAEHLPAAIPRCQILIVTGKGGVGKTAIATALATQSARQGKRTLLTVYEREDVRHPLLGTKTAYALQESRPNLWVSRLDARLSLKEYIHTTIPLHRLYDWILDGQVLGQFTDAAPGFDELMSLGKLYDLAEGSDGKAHFDQIIFDAPATGHCALMLRTPRVVAEAVPSGPLHQNALHVHDVLADKARCAVLVVALAEEMAIQEGRELHHYVGEDLGFHAGPMIINRIRPPRFSEQEIQHLSTAKPRTEQGRAILNSALAHDKLSRLQGRYIAQLRQTLPQVVEVPQIIQDTFRSTALINSLANELKPAMTGGQS